MDQNESMRKNYALSYSIIVLLASWAITLILSSDSSVFLKWFAIIMFVPGIVAIPFSLIQYRSVKVAFKSLITKFSLKSILFGIGYPITVIALCAIAALLAGIGDLNIAKLQALFSIKGIITLIIVVILNCFTGALGEEFGWRGFLLPSLTAANGKLKATIWVSVVWALYHMPALFLLAQVTGVGNPVLVAIIQGCAAFLVNFAFSYCYYQSYSLYPVLLLHAMWNYVNTKVLGDIYNNAKGIIEGNIFYINGEGVLGVIVIGLTSLWFLKKMKMNR